MGNHLLDGGEESQNFENFQEYPSFDNGILDLDTMSSEIMGAETVNPGTMSVETMNSGSMNPGSMNNGILDMETMNPGNVNPATISNGTMNSEFANPGMMNPEFVNPVIMSAETMDSGNMNTETINPGIGNPATISNGTMNSGTMNSEFVNPGTMDSGIMNPEFVNPGNMDSGSMQSRAINSGTMNPEIPVQQSFDPGISDTSNSFEQAIVPGTIDSRSFTHTEAEWQRIQAGGPTVNYVDSTDSWDNYREDKPRNFFRTLLAFFVSIIVAGVLALINVMLYNIEYISTMQCLLSMLPPIGLFTCYYYMIGKRTMDVPEGLLLIVVNEILSYIMFHSVMAHNVQKIYPELSFMEAWKFVDVMKAITEMHKIYYLHFAIIFGIASLMGIVYGLLGIRGMLEGNGVRWRR